MEYPPDSFPKNGKNGTKDSAQGSLPGKCTHSQSRKASQPQISLAYGEADVQKGGEQSRQKQKIAKQGVPGP